MNKGQTTLALLFTLGIGYMVGKRFSWLQRKRIAGPRYLIINADDFGLSEGVTQGIIEAWKNGVVTSTSAMINIEGAAGRIAKAHRQYPRLPIGLHLNMTAGKPVLPPEKVPSLVNENGYFHSRFDIFNHLPDISLDEVKAEFYAQAELLRKTGITFDHIDYHQHMMVIHPPFYLLVCELAQAYNVPVRQPVPEQIYGHIKLKGTGMAGKSVSQTVKFLTQNPNTAFRLVPQVIPATYEKQALLLKTKGIKTTNWLVIALYERASVDNFISVLQQLPPGVSELVMHPGKLDEQLQMLGGNYIEQRVDELAMLTDTRTQKAMRDHQIIPVDFSFVQSVF